MIVAVDGGSSLPLNGEFHKVENAHALFTHVGLVDPVDLPAGCQTIRAQERAVLVAESLRTRATGVNMATTCLVRLRDGVNVTARMHIDELDIDRRLVRSLLRQQFPDWADLRLQRIEPSGTVNAIFRLGDSLAVRRPRREGPTRPGGKGFDWLPRLAPQLPVEIPLPIGQGRPSDGYPWFWEILTWVQGETLPVEELDTIQAARDLAEIVRALQRVNPMGAPPGRGIPLAERDTEIRDWLARFDGDAAVTEAWERALAAPPWDGPPVWHHGDLDARNWLVRNGRISGVIDWGAMGVGDPACDVMVAWKLHSPVAREAFREALPTDEATWERARGWVLSQAVAILAYYTPENNPTLYHEADSWLDQVLRERE